MAALISASFFLICFLICYSGALEIIEADLEIKKADLGQDAILPCKAPNNNNILAVEWIRPDQDPDYVLLYRDGRIDPHNQHPSYQNRVDLQDKEMKNGNVSLILMNVKMEDTGRYVCRVFQKGTNRKKRSNLDNDPISIINLKIRPSGDMVGIIVGSVVGVILLAAASVGFLIYKRPMKMNLNPSVPPYEPAAIEMLTVPEHHQYQVQLV